MEYLPDLIRQRLQDRDPIIRPEWKARPAAVLIPLYLENGRWHALFTRRTDDVEAHQGQVSFPGGVVEEADRDAIQTATREAQEEIGIKPQDVNVLGVLDTLLTLTQFQIVPVVGVIPWPYVLRINKSEVASVFGVPLDWLADPGNREERSRELFSGGPSIGVHYFKPYHDQVIWGVTARITLYLLDTIA
jgi:8-oxo-dGTP pyrophosphatase MutT (NUDIX family)